MAQGVVTDVDVDRVEVHIRELGMAERAITERCDALVEAGTDP